VFELRIEVEFPAGHHLVGYAGDCARPHGHNWKVEVFVRSRKVDQVGIAVDFKLIKAATRELIARWDHQDLNSLPEFKDCNPSAENMAKLVHDKLSQTVNSPAGASTRKALTTWIEKVAIWENDRASASYFEDET